MNTAIWKIIAVKQDEEIIWKMSINYLQNVHKLNIALNVNYTIVKNILQCDTNKNKFSDVKTQMN